MPSTSRVLLGSVAERAETVAVAHLHERTRIFGAV
jgi:hypothetical protein